MPDKGKTQEETITVEEVIAQLLVENMAIKAILIDKKLATADELNKKVAEISEEVFKEQPTE